MDVTPLELPEVLLFTPRAFGDDRGFFVESYNKARFDEAVGAAHDFVQDNHSRSVRGVLRGLHYQLPPHAQGKLVRVVSGEIWDVAVDIRQGSPTFGRWAAATLSAENKRQLWIPTGFAHGFLVLSEAADVIYKTTAYYAPASDRAIAWNDEDIGVKWPLDGAPLLSAKDVAAPGLHEADLFS